MHSIRPMHTHNGFMVLATALTLCVATGSGFAGVITDRTVVTSNGDLTLTCRGPAAACPGEVFQIWCAATNHADVAADITILVGGGASKVFFGVLPGATVEHHALTRMPGPPCELSEVDFLNEACSSLGDCVSCTIFIPCTECPLLLDFDVRPEACPNTLNTHGQGAIPMAVLGGPDFDVSRIDPTTLLLEGLSPEKIRMEDVAAAPSGTACACTAAGPDGYLDMTLKFRAADVRAVLGPMAPGDAFALTLTGTLVDGTIFRATDCVEVPGGDPGHEVVDVDKSAVRTIPWSNLKVLYR